MCSPQHGVQSWRGKSAGVAKRPVSSFPTRNPSRYNSRLFHRCRLPAWALASLPESGFSHRQPPTLASSHLAIAHVRGLARELQSHLRPKDGGYGVNTSAAGPRLAPRVQNQSRAHQTPTGETFLHMLRPSPSPRDRGRVEPGGLTREVETRLASNHPRCDTLDLRGVSGSAGVGAPRHGTAVFWDAGPLHSLTLRNGAFANQVESEVSELKQMAALCDGSKPAFSFNRQPHDALRPYSANSPSLSPTRRPLRRGNFA
jgi:hypothetical protein